MSDRESSAVGFRLRGFGPTDLSTYPDSVKLMFWTWVTDAALRVKDRELSRGWDKDGNVHPLRPKTIKYRKSEVGPVTRTAPRLIPALALSRVRSLLRGRAHHQSAELYWDFDAVTGDSFAVILHHAAEAGHDVFGISPRGTAQIKQEAIDKWQAWKEQAGHARPSVSVPGFPGPPRVSLKREVRKPIAKREVFAGAGARGRMDLENFDLSSDGEKLTAAIKAGEFSGFRRLNARGEQWNPGIGIAAPLRQSTATPRQTTATTPKAVAERALGVRFVHPPGARGNPGYTTVVIDVAKVAADLALDQGQYVGTGGTGAAISGRYEEFQQFLARAREKGVSIEQPRMYLAVDTGRIDIGDGRHRFAVFRDLGAAALPVTVRRSEAAEIRQRYGYA